MQLTTVSSISDCPSADVLVLPFWQGAKGAESASSKTAFEAEIATLLKSGDFLGKQGETALIYTGKKDSSRLLLLGCGKKSEASAEMFRRAVSVAVKLCQKMGWESLNLECPSGMHTAAVEGLCLASYRFDGLKGESSKEDKKVPLRKACLLGIDKQKSSECKRAETIAESVNFTRDLINGNADDVTPQYLAETAKKLAKEHSSLKPKILGKKELEKQGLGLLLAVSRGSACDPALILVEYKGRPNSKECIALVGKGVTYDTGGLNLKPTGSMETMKEDMSGAAAVLGTLKAAAKLKLPVNIIGVIPTTENAIGSRSYKPGDVYKSYSGKTVEITNTDAEGRLVLADAISYVQKHYKPTKLIDLATLTGGVVVALGEQVSGLFSNNDQLSEALFQAGEKTFERIWRLPLYDEYKEVLKSKIADLKNCGDRKASSISGALFIQEFISKIPWAHLDIAGTAYREPKDYHQTPATGVGVRLLVEYLSGQKI